jgi:ATP-binding protein involved in chromosome partitioning
MPGTDPDRVRAALAQVSYPGFQRDIVSFGLVKDIAVAGDQVTVELVVRSDDEALREELRRSVARAVTGLEGVSRVEVELSGGAPARLPTAGEGAAQPRPSGPAARQIIGVASGKGGVGKSTVAVNTAVALAQEGQRVGFLDADVHGPSAPLLFGLSERRPEQGDEQGRPLPLEAHGVKVMSMGFFLEKDSPVIWRGPIVGNFIRQLLNDVAWGELDVLVIDFPPGTGDAQLTISQTIRMHGTIIVTTPNELALVDAIKGIGMFRRVEVPVLGVIENMSHFVCPSCQEATEIFGESKVAERVRPFGVTVMGRIPIDPAVVVESDQGRPVVVSHPDGLPAQAYREIARGIVARAAEPAAGPPGMGSFLDRFGGEESKEE